MIEIGVDIGGTFTDVVLLREGRIAHYTKVASTPADPIEGIVRGRNQVFVRGELWRARAEAPLHDGDRVRVDALDGLTLDVHRIEA